MRRLLLIVILAVSVCFDMDAQFRSNKLGVKSGASTVTGPPGSAQQPVQGDDVQVVTDSTQGFSLMKMVRGYAGRDTLLPGYMLLGSAIVPGASQAYNRQYWKIPVVYGGIGAGIYGGIHFNKQFKETGDDKYKRYSLCSYIGAGAVYWAHLLDGVACYKTSIKNPVPAKSTFYSLLLPGLGQANNGDYWKIPIWYGGLLVSGYCYHLNDIQYKRFKYICSMDKTKPESGYVGQITASQGEWYRDSYRRYRDYSLIAVIAVYALNVIDANVFSYMADFEVTDNIAYLEVSPAVIQPQLTHHSADVPYQPALGLNLKLNF